MRYEPIPGQAHNPSEEETMSVIRSVLTATDQPEGSRKPSRAERKATARAQAQNDPKKRAFVERTSQPKPRRRAADLPELSVDQATTENRESIAADFGAMVVPLLTTGIAKLREFRPSGRMIGLAVLALLVFLRPHWFLITGILGLVLVLGSFLIFGSDRVWGFVLKFLNFVEARDPKRADRMRDRLDTFACRWDTFLERFPEETVESFYMPDLQAMKEADDAYHKATQTRLARMAELEQRKAQGR